LALLSTLSASAATSYARTHVGTPGLAGAAAVHGFTTGFWWAAGIFAVCFVMALVVLPSKAGAHECSLRTALSRGIAYAHHLEAAAQDAAHALRMSAQPLPQADGTPAPDGSPDLPGSPPGHPVG